MWLFPFRCGVQLRSDHLPLQRNPLFLYQSSQSFSPVLGIQEAPGRTCGCGFLSKSGLDWEWSLVSMHFSVLLNKVCFVQVAIPAGLEDSSACSTLSSVNTYCCDQRSGAIQMFVFFLITAFSPETFMILAERSLFSLRVLAFLG